MPLSWPPTKQDFIDVMQSALRQSSDPHVNVLVYADNPSLLIFDPIAEFIHGKYMTGTARQGERTIKVTIGEQD